MTRRERSARRRGSLPLLAQLLYRFPMEVAELRIYPCAAGQPSYPVCPRCGATMEREYMSFCSRCGQKLDWGRYPYAKAVYVMPEDARRW